MKNFDRIKVKIKSTRNNEGSKKLKCKALK